MFACALAQSRDAQEMSSYYAWMARVDIEKGDIESALFFQEESAYFSKLARNTMGLVDN